MSARCSLVVNLGLILSGYLSARVFAAAAEALGYDPWRARVGLLLVAVVVLVIRVARVRSDPCN